jgi:hypothetical protein
VSGKYIGGVIIAAIIKITTIECLLYFLMKVGVRIPILLERKLVSVVRIPIRWPDKLMSEVRYMT